MPAQQGQSKERLGGSCASQWRENKVTVGIIFSAIPFYPREISQFVVGANEGGQKAPVKAHGRGRFQPFTVANGFPHDGSSSNSA